MPNFNELETYDLNVEIWNCEGCNENDQIW